MPSEVCGRLFEAPSSLHGRGFRKFKVALIPYLAATRSVGELQKRLKFSAGYMRIAVNLNLFLKIICYDQ